MKSGCQIYVKGSVEAAALYQKAFNLVPGMTALNDDGTYEHLSLMSGENEIIAIAEDKLDYHDDKVGRGKCPVMSCNVYDFNTKEEVDHAYAVLSEGARWNENPDGPGAPVWDKEGDGDVYGFSLMDKFGVHWGVMIFL